MTDPSPTYDVLAKRDTPSWNAQTRAVIDERLALSERGDVLTPRQRATLRAAIDRIVPQPAGRAPVNTMALVLDKIGADATDGHRPEGLPRTRAAWEAGIDALDAEARARHAAGFAELDAAAMDDVLGHVGKGDTAAKWPFDARLFWSWRLLPDILGAYFSHPSAWSAMGFGGPASPRGYVRMDADRRDPWEAPLAP